MPKKRITQEEKEAYKGDVMKIMSRHVGRNNAVPMGDLYRRVTGENYDDKINGTRLLRTLITELRDEGIPVCSYSSHSGGGYYLASVGGELRDYCQSIRGRALRILQREARLRKITVPQLLGEIQYEITEAA